MVSALVVQQLFVESSDKKDLTIRRRGWMVRMMSGLFTNLLPPAHSSGWFFNEGVPPPGGTEYKGAVRT